MNFQRLYLTALLLVVLIGGAARAQSPPSDDNTVVTSGPVSTVQGGKKIQPAQGSEGTGVTYNFLPYILPGQYANAGTQQIENQPFTIAYANRRQPLQTSDWWTGIGLQWSNNDQTSGWVVGRKPEEGQAGRSKAFIAEPFHLQFVDYGDSPGNAASFPGLAQPIFVCGQRAAGDPERAQRFAGEFFVDPQNFSTPFIAQLSCFFAHEFVRTAREQHVRRSEVISLI